MGKNKIDLLIISHFHEEHINGIELLLSKFKVDSVVLPYISNVERAFSLAKPSYSKTRYTLEMLIDPGHFFLSEERQVRRDILIGPGSGTTSSDNKIFKNSNNDNDVFNVSIMKEDSELIEKLVEDTYYEEQLTKKNLFVIKHEQYITLEIFRSLNSLI
ncbi:hypothetical protein ACQKFM_22490 [Paenibacillus xylanexedens]|uniref:hypothetical protein n=1 Tax=Paenibacillus xylanexedens TaxID=528191 RepID=UPI003D04FCE3